MSHRPRAAILVEQYQEYLDNQDTAAFITAVTERYTSATLERLLVHEQVPVRRAAVTSLGLVGDYRSNAALGRMLTAGDRTVRMLAENAIRSVWRRDGDATARERLEMVVRLNRSQQYDDAVVQATQLVEQCPWFAEAWNQRAVAFYNLARHADSIQDCREALEINPYHFDAATGIGQCYLQLSDQRAALECFRRALKLNPTLEGVRAGIEFLERELAKADEGENA